MKVGEHYLVKLFGTSSASQIRMIIPAELVRKYCLKKGDLVAIKDLGDGKLEVLLKPDVKVIQ